MTIDVSQLPIEMQLLLECVSNTHTDSNITRIRNFTSNRLDWNYFVELTERNQVTPLVHRSLKAATGSVPPDTLRSLAVRSLVTSQRNRLFADELIRLIALLDRAGLDVISYKGPTAASLLYGNVGLRVFGDMDFLVERNDLDAVCCLLEREGYTNQIDAAGVEKLIEEREQKEYCFKSGPITLEPHWAITARRLPFKIDYPSLWTRAQRIDFNGAKVRTFGAEDMLLVLCVCGSKGHWHRLQMVTDIAATIRAFPDLDWEDCFARAEQSRSARMLRLGLLLAHELLGAKLTVEMIDRIHEDRAVPGIAETVVDRICSPPAVNPWTRQGPTMFSPLLFRLREGWADKLVYLFRTTTTARRVHLQRIPLPPVLFGMYRVVVPIHDYVVIPLVNVLRERTLNRGHRQSRSA